MMGALVESANFPSDPPLSKAETFCFFATKVLLWS